MKYPFSEADSNKAHEEWGANCGPNALAFFLGKHIDEIRGKIPGFDEKRYVSPTMMKQGLAAFGHTVTSYCRGTPAIDTMFGREPSLTRIQWCGPWTASGANPKWAYRQTHWIVSYRTIGLLPTEKTIFDVNGGIIDFGGWKAVIVPLLTKEIPRADGKWYPTHVWRLDK